MSSKRNLATLTPEENAVWCELFAVGVNGGLHESDADAEAWRGLCEQFPRLREFDGAKP